jgi:hypothetical protein
MKKEEFKTLTATVKEMSQHQIDAANAVKNAAVSTNVDSKKLFKSENKPFLIKAGLALIAFPDPTISDLVGTAMVAAGAVQMGIKRQAVYVDDLPKAFKSAMKDLKAARDLI